MPAKFRVLIVEDDSDLRKILGLALAGEYEGLGARNGLDALNITQHLEPDLFIVDGMMPVLDGWAFVERLRKLPSYENAPVIFISAKSERQSIAAGYEKGADIYLVKPVDPDRLLKVIEMQIEEHSLRPRAKKHTMEEFRAKYGGKQRKQASESLEAPPLEHPRPAPTPSTPPEPAPAEGDTPRKATAGMPDHSPRILIVDDDPDIVHILRRTLLEHYEVYGATDGVDAMDKLRTYQPDLLIVDWMMPRLPGMKLIKMVRESHGFETMPIVLISAKAMHDNELRMIEHLGVNAFISKPFDLDEIVRTVERYIDPDYLARYHRERRSPTRHDEDWIH